MPPRPTYYFCGTCTGFHDATQDAHIIRHRSRLVRKHGPDGWDEIRESEVEAWRAGVAQQRETTDNE